MTTMEDQPAADSTAAPRTNVHVAGLGRSTGWAHRVLRSRGVPSTELPDQACMLHVHVETATLEHHGPDRSYRPYLYLTGELRAIVPDPEAEDQPAWPHGITAVTFAPATGETVCGFYEFDDEQLVSLVRKGYFWSGFEAPDTITGFEWELPAIADLGIVDPVDAVDVPLVSTNVHDISALEVDLANSGYDLVTYFPDRSEQKAREVQPAQEMGVKTRDDEFDNLFAGEALVLPAQSPSGTGPGTAAASKSPVVRSLQEQLTDLDPQSQQQVADHLAEALQAVDQETESTLAAFLSAQAAGRTESVEDLFDRYVKTVLEAEERDQATGRAVPAKTADTGLLDFDTAFDIDQEPQPAPEPKSEHPSPAVGVRTYTAPEPEQEPTPTADDDWQLG